MKLSSLHNILPVELKDLLQLILKHVILLGCPLVNFVTWLKTIIKILTNIISKNQLLITDMKKNYKINTQSVQPNFN